MRELLKVKQFQSLFSLFCFSVAVKQAIPFLHFINAKELLWHVFFPSMNNEAKKLTRLLQKQINK